MVLNGTLTGAAFSNVSSDSFVQYSTSETACTGGIIVASGYIYDAGVKQIDLDVRDISMVSTIAGTQDTLTVLVTNMLGTLNVTAGIEWIEQE
jgi:hypothetical protein